MKKDVKNFAKFTGKHLCQSLFLDKVAGLIYTSLFLNKVAGLRPATLSKKRLWYKCFPVNFAKFFRAPPGDCFWPFDCFNYFHKKALSQMLNRILFTLLIITLVRYNNSFFVDKQIDQNHWGKLFLCITLLMYLSDRYYYSPFWSNF